MSTFRPGEPAATVKGCLYSLQEAAMNRKRPANTTGKTNRREPKRQRAQEVAQGNRNAQDDSDITNVGGSASGRRGEHGRNRTRGRLSE